MKNSNLLRYGNRNFDKIVRQTRAPTKCWIGHRAAENSITAKDQKLWQIMKYLNRRVNRLDKKTSTTSALIAWPYKYIQYCKSYFKNRDYLHRATTKIWLTVCLDRPVRKGPSSGAWYINDRPLATSSRWSHFKLWPVDVTWSTLSDDWSLLVMALKYLVFLSCNLG